MKSLAFKKQGHVMNGVRMNKAEGKRKTQGHQCNIGNEDQRNRPKKSFTRKCAKNTSGRGSL